MTTVCNPDHPDITDEMWDKINAIIKTGRNKLGALITVLRECQDVVGYLPRELLIHISQGLNVPKSQVFGVVTFYSLFSLEPKGRHTIKICLGTACYVKGIKEIMDGISKDFEVQEGTTSENKRFSMEAIRCLGACGLAPVIVVDQDIHGNLLPKEVFGIINKYE
ncbi:MAG: NAD(P)H-dependent oxidoreductase subunit E [Deltaproteobacteria bacterium]|nr:NAD(P)H-dependent oxidoreductase subunit E [Deltaproteobacteria bacterium]MBW2220278.1 NAD(P)H-dependent oxidoreductase subunit E [Deltaproteobacteria bacterium]